MLIIFSSFDYVKTEAFDRLYQSETSFFYLKCRFETVGFSELLRCISNVKKKLMDIFSMKENLIKCQKGAENPLIKILYPVFGMKC